MAYIGNQPTVGQFRKLDDISGSFNGTNTAFTMQISGSNTSAGSVYQLMVSLGGVIQNPGTDFTVSGSTLTFTTAPTSGLDFFGVLMGQPLNVGTVADSGVTTAKIADGAVTTVKIADGVDVKHNLGSDSAPSITFTGDTDTGVYSPGANQLALATFGTGRLFVDSVGRVGIGTSSLSRSLHVNGGTDGNVRINGASGYYSVLELTENNSTTAGTYWQIQKHPAAGQFRIDNGSARLVITTAGNVGIGTTSPSQALHVVGNGLLTGTVDVGNETSGRKTLTLNSSDNGAAVLFRADGVTRARIEVPDGDTALVFGVEAAVTPTERARIDSSGRLLVGTSTARSWSGVTSLIQAEGTDVNGSSASLSANINSINGGYLSFIKSRGTSLNSNTVVQNNDILGGIYFNGTDGSSPVQSAIINAAVDGTPGANDMPGRLVFYTTADGASTPTERLRIDSFGSLNSQATYDYTAAGSTVVVTSAGQIRRTSSSIKYKKDVEDLESSIAENAINNLRPVWYRTKDPAGDDKQTWSHFGLIAEEVAEVEPRLVRYRTTETIYDEKGAPVVTELATPEPEDVDYARLSVLCLQALQKANQRIETLEAEVAALKGA